MRLTWCFFVWAWCKWRSLRPKAPAAAISQLAAATIKYSGETDAYPILDIGFRHGEKQHEVLLSNEEMLIAEDLGDYFKSQQIRGL